MPDRSIGRRLICLASTAVLIGAAARSGQAAAIERSAPAQELSAEFLVESLGSDVFSVREQASDRLIQFGPAAIPALETGARQLDREVRYRCRRILATIRDIQFQRRLEAFAAGADPEADADLPGWTAYRSTVGTDARARALFVEMLQEEPALLARLPHDRFELQRTVSRRIEQLRISMNMFRRQLSLGTIAALLFVASQDNVTLPELAGQSLFGFCFQPSFTGAMRDGETSPSLQKLLGRWILKAEGWGAHQGMMMAVRYDLKEGLTPAQNTLRNPAASPHVRQFAILTIAKLGDRSSFPILQAQLDDPTPCATQRVDQVKYQTQIRDVALAALVHLHQLDFQDFGFDRAKPHSDFLLTVETLGFATDEQRAAAFEKWRGRGQREPVESSTP